MLNSKKTYYSIREVCDRTELEPHVLRYWESEFSVLRPKKNRAGNRAYREKDIETVLAIKKLLYEEQFTIPGAKKKLSGTKETKKQPETQKKSPKNPKNNAIIKETISELKSILRDLR